MRLGAAALLGFVTCAGVARAQDGVALHGSVRLRVETIDGQARAGTRPAETLATLRTIVQARYRHGALTLGGDLYDSRPIAPARNTAAGTGEVNALEPVQLFAAIALGGAPGPQPHGTLTLGRQTADIGSRRLLANDDYRGTTNGFTGVRLDGAGLAGWRVAAFYLLPQQRLPDDATGIRQARVRLDKEGFDTRIWGTNAARPLAGRLLLDLGAYRFEERDRPGHATRDRRLTTLTARITIPPAAGRWDMEVEVMRQTGSTAASLAPAAARLPVAAGFAHAEAGYQWPGRWQPHLVLEGDYASGDRRDGTYRRFDTLYGMRRGDYAPAGLYNAVSRGNLVAIGPRFEVAPSKRVDGFVTVKKLWLASAVDGFATTGVVDPAGRSGHDGGWQTDARVRLWAIPKRVQLEADGVWLAKGRFLRTAPNRTSDRDTLYLSLNATAFF